MTSIQAVTPAFANLWAKTGPKDEGAWQPLLHHLLDVAAAADEILHREPQPIRDRLSRMFQLAWPEARAWTLLLIACHDLGKACPAFQRKWDGARELLPKSGLDFPRGQKDRINHAYISQIALSKILEFRGWNREAADLAADAVGCHHGSRAGLMILRNHKDVEAIGNGQWTRIREDIYKCLEAIFLVTAIPRIQRLEGSDFMILAGLTSFADWIGSNRDWFPFGSPDDCKDMQTLWKSRRAMASRALSQIGWEFREPLIRESRTFKDIFAREPRPLQAATATMIAECNEPAVVLIEAPMGEGKTEAAFFAHAGLQRALGHRGMYMALPSQATGNAMFERTLEFLRQNGSGRPLDIQLLHGATLLNDTYQELRIEGVDDGDGKGPVRACEWFTHKKRALLSEYGVGTVDQALLTILPIRHQFVRLWGLANRTVIFDEIHAYDAYTGALLLTLITWLRALGSSVILLSATLPPSFRRKLASRLNVSLPDGEAEYPRITCFTTNKVIQSNFAPDPTRRRSIKIFGIGTEVTDLKIRLLSELSKGGYGLVLVNTVQRAQDLYRSFGDGDAIRINGSVVGKRLEDGTEVVFFHARFPASIRRQREAYALDIFGPAQIRAGCRILIATQVAEQSLDLDFDVMISDLAPIDLVLQRAGRLWRHARDVRPVLEAKLFVAGLEGDSPPSFGAPLWWGKVYEEECLLRTWLVLKQRSSLNVPDDIDPLVREVYDEKRTDVPEWLDERITIAEVEAATRRSCHEIFANHEIIGLPEDQSWNDVDKMAKFDQEETAAHHTLVAKTRLGDPSITVILIPPTDSCWLKELPPFPVAKALYGNAISISRQGIVRALQASGPYVGWSESPLLRNAFPMELDETGHWVRDASVRLDPELGLVYEQKEKA
jgi:CRISPR-associated endonuclease/helicase Cas3